MSDAKALSRQVDGVLVVIQAGRVGLPQVRQTLSTMEQVNANILGLVLNKANEEHGTDGYSGYGGYGLNATDAASASPSTRTRRLPSLTMVEGEQPLRMLVVCTANVCRSPMGEALLRHHLQQMGANVQVTSAGTRAGELSLPVDPHAVDALRGMGVELDGHQPRQASRQVITTDGADLIVTMTREHLRRHRNHHTWHIFPRTFTLRELVRRASITGAWHGDSFAGWLEWVGGGRRASDLMGDDPDDDVSDPYGLGTAAVKRTAAEIDELVRTLVAIGPWDAGPSSVS